LDFKSSFIFAKTKISSMILQNKNAVIYGAGGSLGGAVAKAFAAAGARVFLTGRNLASVQKCADEILANGGIAEIDIVDALDEASIKNHINKVAQKVGEEAIEMVIEAKDNNDELFLSEGADLLFHYLILLHAKGFALKDVTEVLRQRHKK